MQEELDYAEMLEIPVSTVNVVRKKNKKKKDIREKVIEKVNERMEDLPEEEEGKVASTVLVEQEPKKIEKQKYLIIGEFAAACLLCICIFLTNIFMTNSAINTFIHTLFSHEVVKTDSRNYNDFTLSSIVSEASDLSVAISPTGVITFTGKTAVYPVCDGKVSSVTSGDGGYTVVLSHSDSFQSIITGLSSVYYDAGSLVKGNLPVGYTVGEGEVQVMLYEKDSLLNCFNVDSKNCISWKE